MKIHRFVCVFFVTAFTAVMACAGGGTKTKGAGVKGAAAAKSSDQKSGGNAKATMGSATNQGATAHDATCDADLDGVGWCDSDSEIIFCASGSWYLLDC